MSTYLKVAMYVLLITVHTFSAATYSPCDSLNMFFLRSTIFSAPLGSLLCTVHAIKCNVVQQHCHEHSQRCRAARRITVNTHLGTQHYGIYNITCALTSQTSITACAEAAQHQALPHEQAQHLHQFTSMITLVIVYKQTY
jgi:hypothetical protein